MLHGAKPPLMPDHHWRAGQDGPLLILAFWHPDSLT